MYYEITFPNLGLALNPSRVAITILGKPIYWYGICIAVGFLLAVVYCLRRSPDFGIKPDHVLDMLIAAVPAAIVCARAYYCLFNWDAYRSNPISCLYIWQGGLAIYGGVIGGFTAAIIVARVKKISWRAMIDLGGLGFPIGQALGRWGNFFNREAFGVIKEGADPLLKMGLTDAAGAVTYVHPTFLYESVWNLVGFCLLHLLSRHRKFDGQVFLSYVAWYGLGRGIIEGLRADSLYFPGTGLRISQLIAFASCLIAAGWLVFRLLFRENDPEDLFVNHKLQGAVEEPEQEMTEQ